MSRRIHFENTGWQNEQRFSDTLEWPTNTAVGEGEMGVENNLPKEPKGHWAWQHPRWQLLQKSQPHPEPFWILLTKN